MHTEIHKKSWGHEIWLVNIPKYCGKILIVEQDKYCSLHAHKIKEETFYVLEGEFEITTCQGEINGDGDVVRSEGRPVSMWTKKQGEVLHVPPLLLHRFKGLCVSNRLIEISSQHFEDDSYRVEPSCGW